MDVDPPEAARWRGRPTPTTTGASRARTTTRAPAGVGRGRPGGRAARAGLPDLAWQLWEPCSPAGAGGPSCDPDRHHSRPLPTGTTLLEASAGTGKTWTIGALVTRHTSPRGRPAGAAAGRHLRPGGSQELREQVRHQLVEAERALAGAPRRRRTHRRHPSAARRRRRRAPAAAPAGGPGAGRLRRGDDRHDPPVLLAGARLLGVAGDTDSRARLVEDLDDLVRPRWSTTSTCAPSPSPTATRRRSATVRRSAIARAVVNDPQARLEPADARATRPGGGWRSRRRCVPS